ncbi:DUF3263 domain-containing protein [Micromonospora costi]|uniref:DUF3263 domain-containing protein n=1 Tax=Micromonospora costi TaxID=1530042 RepID=UPI0033EB521B
MQPADAAPAAAEPPTDAPDAAPSRGTRPGHVPPPRSAPPAEAVPDAEQPVIDAEETPPAGPAETRAGLTERERAILAFEQRWWRHAGAKEQAIRDAFGLSATRYYQLLNGLLDNPAALAAEPVLVGRLRRLRSSRARNRRR